MHISVLVFNRNMRNLVLLLSLFIICLVCLLISLLSYVWTQFVEKLNKGFSALLSSGFLILIIDWGFCVFYFLPVT